MSDKHEGALLGPHEFGRIIEEREKHILEGFISRIKSEVAGASQEGRAYLTDHLPQILHEIAMFLECKDERKDYWASAQLAAKHGIQRANGQMYTIDDLRKEYSILNEILLAQVPAGTGLSPHAVALFGKIIATSVSFATEVFIRNSASELKQHRADMREALNLQKNAEDDHRWFELALDRVPKPLFLLDLETKDVAFSNRAAQSMLGLIYAGAERLKLYGPVFTAYDSLGNLLAPHQIPSSRVLNGEHLAGVEIILVTPVGEFYLKCYSEELPPTEGRNRSALLLLQDITSLKKTEAQLRKTQQDLSRAIQISKIGFWQLRIGSDRITVSPILLQQFGLDPQLFTGQLSEAFEVIHHEDRERVGRAVEEAITGQSEYQIEYRVIHPSGEIRWISAKGEMTRDEKGQPEFFSGTCIDITEDRQRNQELEDARQLAEKANSAKSQFLANMSHEIRTPLGAIMGFASLLKDDAVPQVERKSFISVIERNSTQLLRIIDDILDLSKVEAGMMLIENIEFSLPELLSDFSSLMGFKAREKGIGFISRAVTPLPKFVKSDPTRLRQILMNAVGNAIKFTDQGGVELRMAFESDYLIFEVQDTGRGISTDQSAHLFQPFAQADSSTTRKYGGTGLGLVLTRSLAEALGGTFELKQSAIGEGSTFRIKIGVNPAEKIEMIDKVGFQSEEGASRSPVSSGRLAGIRILLVEDSPDNQALISIMLNRAGAQVDVAGDGEEGYLKALRDGYDLVVMDVQMPVMDGIVAVKKLRDQGYRKPILALTAHAMKEERIRCISAGFTDFLSKPVNREELTNMIVRYSR